MIVVCVNSFTNDPKKEDFVIREVRRNEDILGAGIYKILKVEETDDQKFIQAVQTRIKLRFPTNTSYYDFTGHSPKVEEKPDEEKLSFERQEDWKKQLNTIFEATDKGLLKLNNWEQEFIDSISKQFFKKSKPLSFKQSSSLRKIYNKVE